MSRKIVTLVLFISLASVLNSSNQEYTNIDNNFNGDCNGSVTATIAYEDGEITRVRLHGKDSTSFTVVTRFNTSTNLLRLKSFMLGE